MIILVSGFISFQTINIGLIWVHGMNHTLSCYCSSKTNVFQSQKHLKHQRRIVKEPTQLIDTQLQQILLPFTPVIWFGTFFKTGSLTWQWVLSWKIMFAFIFSLSVKNANYIANSLFKLHFIQYLFFMFKNIFNYLKGRPTQKETKRSSIY